MKVLKLSLKMAGGVVLIGLAWFGVKSYRCHQRNAAFAREIETIKHDAQAQLRVGTQKADVAHFYSEHKIPFEVVTWPWKDGGFEAIGTLYTVGGCAPLGCGTDQALIGVRVKVDASGTTTGAPEVVDLYTDCL